MLEYVFEDKNYENALIKIKATIMDVFSNGMNLVSTYEEKIKNEKDAETKQKLIDVCNTEKDTLMSLLKVVDEIEKNIQKIDACSKNFELINDQNIAKIMGNIKKDEEDVSKDSPKEEVVSNEEDSTEKDTDIIIPSVDNNISKEEAISNTDGSNEEEVTSNNVIIPSVDNNTSKKENTSNEVVIPSVQNNNIETSNNNVIPNVVKEKVTTPVNNVQDNSVIPIINSTGTTPVTTQQEVATPSTSPSTGTPTQQDIFFEVDGARDMGIITSGKQMLKLRKSHDTQKALLRSRGNAASSDINETTLVENGLLPPSKDNLQSMVEEAQRLYSSGDVKKAQELFDKISELNKQVVPSAKANTIS